jgi:hypothetical protein
VPPGLKILTNAMSFGSAMIKNVAKRTNGEFPSVAVFIEHSYLFFMAMEHF